MSTETTQAYWGEENILQVFNGQAIIDLVFAFFYDDEDETLFDFPNFANTYLNIYEDSDMARTIKTFSGTTGLTRSSNCLVLNASESDMTFEDKGKYYYELGYVRAGGYEQVLRYGTLIVR